MMSFNIIKNLRLLRKLLSVLLLLWWSLLSHFPHSGLVETGWRIDETAIPDVKYVTIICNLWFLSHDPHRTWTVGIYQNIFDGRPEIEDQGVTLTVCQEWPLLLKAADLGFGVVVVREVPATVCSRNHLVESLFFHLTKTSIGDSC